MQFSLEVDYPTIPNQAQHLVGYFELPSFAQARLGKLGLTGQTVRVEPENRIETELFGHAHQLVFDLAVKTNDPAISEKIRRFLPTEIKAKVVEEWQAVSSSDNPEKNRRGEYQFQFEGLPVKVQARWELVPVGSDLVRRRINGELQVRVPFVGKTIEEKVAKSLLPRIKEIEETLAAQWVAKLEQS